MVAWLLPAAFVLHDAEELFTMPGWFSEHEARIRAALSRWGLEAYAGFLPTTYAQAAIAIGIFFAIFVAVTAGMSLRPASRLWRTLYGGLLGAFLLHVLAHAGQSIAFHGYTPGLVTAFLVVAPASLYIGKTLAGRGALDPNTSAIAAIMAFAAFPFAVLAAFRLSHYVLMELAKS